MPTHLSPSIRGWFARTPALGLAAGAALGLALASPVQASPVQAQPALPPASLTFSQPFYTGGETIQVTLSGKPDDVPVLFISFLPGPTTLPGIGEVQVGFSREMEIIFLPRFDSTGTQSFACPTTCDEHVFGQPLFMQFITIDMVTKVPTALSNPAVLNLITGDCGDCTAGAIADPALNPSGDFEALWLGAIGTDFVFVAGGQYTERPDGTAKLVGLVQSRSEPSHRFMLNADFAGRLDPTDAGYPPPGSPKLELLPIAYAANGGSIHPETWHYFSMTLGTLVGFDAYAGAKLSFDNLGPAFQVGVGANGKNGNFGGSGWLHVVTSVQPTDPGIVLPADLQGDLNVDLGGDCVDCAKAPDDHALWLPGISLKLVFEPGAAFIENGCGFATLNGIVHDSDFPGHRFDVSVTLTDKVSPGGLNYPPLGSPHETHDPSLYAENGGPIDTNLWHYYLTTNGTLTGLNDYAGAVITVTRFGPAFQVGLDASTFSAKYGASGWLDADIVSQPTQGAPLVLSTDHGDINVDLGECNLTGP